MSELTKSKPWSLNVYQLKLLACFFMLIDHIGYLLLPEQMIWRAVGRLALPIFAYLIANGWRYTKSKLNYFLRLLIFALACHLPLVIFVRMKSLNIFFTLSLGLLAIALWEWSQNLERKRNRYLLGGLLVLAVAWLGQFIKVDYGWFGVLLIFSCHLFHGRWLRLGLVTVGLCLLQWGQMLLGSGVISGFNYLQILCVGAFFFLARYNGRQGRPAKWLFYIFYPAHFLLLSALAICIQFKFDWDLIFNQVIPYLLNR